MHTVWTGERVRLRPFASEEEWLGLYDELHSVPNDFWGCWWKARPQRKKDFEPAGMLDAEKYSVFAVERLDTGELVGYEEHGAPAPGSIRAWVGTFLRPKHWHRGFGIEAKQLCLCYLFESYPVLRVDSGTLENHTRARKGLEACGMTFEGRVRKCHPTADKFHDFVCYRIFREEWLELPFRQIVRRG